MIPRLHYDAALCSVDETVRYLRTSRTTLYRLATEGRLTPIKLGRRTLYRKTDLDAFVASLSEPVAA